MSAPENPLHGFVTGFCSTLATWSVISSYPAGESSWCKNILRVERMFHAAHQLKIRTLRPPNYVWRGFYFRWAPLQHRRSRDFRLAAYLKHFSDCSRQSLMCFRQIPLRQECGVENPGGSRKRNKIEFALRRQHSQFSLQSGHRSGHCADSKNRSGWDSFNHQSWKFANLYKGRIRFGSLQREELFRVRGARQAAELALVPVHDGGLACRRNNDGPSSRFDSRGNLSREQQRGCARIGDFHHLRREDGMGDRAAEIKRGFRQ